MRCDARAVRQNRLIMANDFLDYDFEDWDEDDEDQVLYESEEFAERYSFEPEKTDEITTDDLPVLPLRGVVVYPMMWLPLPIGQRRSVKLVEDNLPENRIIALVTSKHEDVENPSPDQIHEIGTAAQVHRVLRTPDGTIRLLVQGLERIRILEYVQEKPYLRARVEIIPEIEEENLETEAIMRAVQELFRRTVELEPQMPDELSVMAMNVENARQLAYLVASSMRLGTDESQRLLELDSIYDKLMRLDPVAQQRDRGAGTRAQDPVRGAGRDGAHAARLLPARTAEGHPEGTGRRRRTVRRHPRTRRAH